jgi:hypothetical protein
VGQSRPHPAALAAGGAVVTIQLTQKGSGSSFYRVTIGDRRYEASIPDGWTGPGGLIFPLGWEPITLPDPERVPYTGVLPLWSVPLRAEP